jgi:hypothetical protein
MVRSLGSIVALVVTTLWPAAVGAQERPDLAGNWIRGGGPVVFSPWEFSSEGQRKYSSYDFAKNDPGYSCIASSWARAWMNPNVLVRITQNADHVRLQHEFMDIDRVVPLVDPMARNPKRSSPIAKMPSLGRSSAWYDGDTLVIETVDIAPGWLATMEQWAGLPQSARMHTVERLRRSGNSLSIEATHVDSAYYRKPVIVTIPYQRTDWQLMHYGCTPEEAAVVAPRQTR